MSQAKRYEKALHNRDRMVLAKRYEKALHNRDRMVLAIQDVENGEIEASPADLRFLNCCLGDYNDELLEMSQEAIEA